MVRSAQEEKNYQLSWPESLAGFPSCCELDHIDLICCVPSAKTHSCFGEGDLITTQLTSVLPFF